MVISLDVFIIKFGPDTRVNMGINELGDCAVLLLALYSDLAGI